MGTAAADAPATRRNLWRRRLWCAAGALVAALFAVLAVWLWSDHRSGVEAERAGARATATITEVDVQNLGGGRSGGRVHFEFTDDEGTAHDGDVLLDRRISRYQVGQRIEVSYPPADPSAAVVIGDGTDPAPLPWVIPAIGAAVVALLAAYGAWCVRRAHRVLRDNPWVEVPSRLVQVGVGAGHALSLLELDGAPDDGKVLATAISWRTRPMADIARRTWVAGDDRHFYLAGLGGAPVVRAKRLRLTKHATGIEHVTTPLHSRVHPDQ